MSPYLHNEELIEEGEENSVDVFLSPEPSKDIFKEHPNPKCGALLLHHELH